MTPRPLTQALEELVPAINLLHRQRLLIPSLMMVYATIDILGALGRPDEAEEGSGHTFRAWVDTYLLPGSRLACDADDLWNARCGLLHAYEPQGRLSRRGKARQILYAGGVLDEAARQTLSFGLNDYVWVISGDLFEAMSRGIQRFLADIETDPHLERRVHARAKQFYARLEPQALEGAG